MFNEKKSCSDVIAFKYKMKQTNKQINRGGPRLCRTQRQNLIFTKVIDSGRIFQAVGSDCVLGIRDDQW